MGDGDTVVYINLSNTKEIENVRLEEMKTALEHIFGVQTLSPLAQSIRPQLNQIRKSKIFCRFVVASIAKVSQKVNAINEHKFRLNCLFGYRR